MKRIVLLLVACVCFSSLGCLSGFIAGSGKMLSGFENREKVDACFGQPHKVEEIDGEFKATYITRKKIADPNGEYGTQAWALFTLGLSEPPLLAYFSGNVIYYTIAGKEITFTFDKRGRVIEYTPTERVNDWPRMRYESRLKAEEEERKQKEEEAP